MSVRQRKVLLKSFFEVQFSYCPLVWMSHCRELNRTINNIHERSICIFYKDYNSFFKDILKEDSSVYIVHRNVQILAIESKGKPFRHNNE